MKKTGIILAGFLALVSAVIAVLLVGSLLTSFKPMPTEFENTVWTSEDGSFTLTVGEYDENTLQCRSTIIFHASDGDFVYDIYDESRGILALYNAESTPGENRMICDKWLRKTCNASSFTVIINRESTPVYSQSYPQNAELRFTRT